MEEALRPNIDIRHPIIVQSESKPLRAIDQVFTKFDADFDAAVLENEEDDELTFALRSVRNNLVSDGLAAAETVEDCDRISLKLGSDSERFKQQIQYKRDEFSFRDIMQEFHDKHQKIINKSKSSDEDDEALEKDCCDQLRLSCVREGLKVARSPKQLQALLGITLEGDIYLHQLIEEKMVQFPIEVRPS